MNMVYLASNEYATRHPRISNLQTFKPSNLQTFKPSNLQAKGSEVCSPTGFKVFSSYQYMYMVHGRGLLYSGQAGPLLVATQDGEPGLTASHIHNKLSTYKL